MKKALIMIAIIVAVITMAIYDPSGGTITYRNVKNGTGRIHFQIKGDSLYYPHNQMFEKIGKHEFEITWLHGDTSRSIEITHAGVYVASIKDKHYLNGYWQGPYFVYGLPDTVFIDSIVVPNTNYGLPHVDTIAVDRYFTINRGGVIDTIVTTYIQRCYNETCDSIFYRQPHAEKIGFWSGLIDTLTVERFKQPLRGGGKILTNDDGIIYMLDQWRVSH